MDDTFRGSWALVTGASSGIGEELARQLAERGANVILTARSREKLEALAAQIGAAHAVQTRVVVADLAADGGLASLLRDVDALDVSVDHVIANAGYGTWGPFAEADTASQVQMVRVNCEALVGLVHHSVRRLVTRRRGGVILVASTASFQPTPMFAVYAATKAFVRTFGEALADELRDTGVRVTVLCPGPVHTGFQQRAGSQIAKAQGAMVLSAEEVARAALAGYEARRVVVVPGALNRVGAAIASTLPTAVVVPAVRRLMSLRKSSE